MPNAPSSSTVRGGVGVILALSILVFLLHAISVRPRLWPAGVGLTLSGNTTFASLSEPEMVPRIKPPDLGSILGQPIVVTRVAPAVVRGTVMERTGNTALTIRLEPGETASRLHSGMAVDPVTAPDSRAANDADLDLNGRIPPDPARALALWAAMYTRGPGASIAFRDGPETRLFFTLDSRPIWALDRVTRAAWLRLHLGPLMQMAAFLAAASILVALGSRGLTATLMTLALIATAVANAGPMFGAEREVPVIGSALLLFAWLATPLSFPIIGLAVLHFPSRAPILDRHRWIYAGLAALPAPMLAISLSAALFLIAGVGVGPLSWFATHSWIFDASFALALAANVLIVIEGVYRYRTIVDANERRRIQLVVYTCVPAVFAYALKAGIPLLSSLAGDPIELPWPIEAALQLVVLLPAVALPYAVAVKHVFSPRTVLRSSLQYALARRTLSVLVVLPIAALVLSLISQSDRPLGDIILGQPLFYAATVALIMFGLRRRVQAQRWIDRQFFRQEYDAREILVGLASRVPREHDPAQLVSLVMTEIDNALQPDSVAVLAGDEARLEPIGALRTSTTGLARDSALATLLRWSDEPLEVFLDDEKSRAMRLPPGDRAWLEAGRVALLVPILTRSADATTASQGPAGASAIDPARSGGGDARSVVGALVLGEKRSEEPYTEEDRRLLSGIAAQMSLALDLSRLRRKVLDSGQKELTPRTPPATTPTVTPTMVSSTPPEGPPLLMMCNQCLSCFETGRLERDPDGWMTCPKDGGIMQPVVGMPSVVDGKYRIDAVVGRGGMGAVFRARDLRLDRDVAIKVVRADLVSDPDSRNRFRREAQIVARLQHPAVVTVFDYGTLADGAAFLVMEYVKGRDLRRVLKRDGTLPPARAAALVAGIAGGIDAAHQAGVLHRDLKPENILLPDSGMGPKVLDFGIAKMTHAAAPEGLGTLTGRGTVVGTPAYMAPEQLRGDNLDGRADVFSLAVVAYEMLTGVLPFGTGSFVEVGIKQAGGTSTVDVSTLPSSLAPVLLRALSVNRDERPVSAGAFAEQLRQVHRTE